VRFARFTSHGQISLVSATDIVLDDAIGNFHSGAPVFPKNEVRAEFHHCSGIYSGTVYEKHRMQILGKVRIGSAGQDKTGWTAMG
jgi:hypothetical protein